MAATISFNPIITTNGAGSFNTSSSGYVQGQAVDDPAIRFALAQGYLASTETLPMWGGVGISENVPTINSAAGTVSSVIGGALIRATTLTAQATGQLTGFSVFNQANAMVNTPQSPVPLAGSGQTVNFYRLGSGARIPVACNPSLVTLRGGLITQLVSWDFNNQVLEPYDASTATYSVTSNTAAFNSATGIWTFTVVMAAASPVAGVGDFINVSGITGTGASLANGNHVVTTFTDNQHFTYQVAGVSGTFSSGAQSGTIVLNYGIGALPVKILDVESNSMIVSYDPVTGFATWNRNGTTAVILI